MLLVTNENMGLCLYITNYISSWCRPSVWQLSCTASTPVFQTCGYAFHGCCTPFRKTVYKQFNQIVCQNTTHDLNTGLVWLQIPSVVRWRFDLVWFDLIVKTGIKSANTMNNGPDPIYREILTCQMWTVSGELVNLSLHLELRLLVGPGV